MFFFTMLPQSPRALMTDVMAVHGTYSQHDHESPRRYELGQCHVYAFLPSSWTKMHNELKAVEAESEPLASNKRRLVVIAQWADFRPMTITISGLGLG